MLFASCMACKHSVPSCNSSCSQGPSWPAWGSSAPSAEARKASFSSESSDDERKSKKDRLRELVHKFTAEALKGVDCTIVERKTLGRVEAVYKLDPSVSWLKFSSRSSGSALAAVQLPWISRLTCVQHLPAYEQEDLLGKQHTADLGKSILVSSGGSHADAGRVPQSVTLVMKDAKDMERFLTCVEVLRLYAAFQSVLKTSAPFLAMAVGLQFLVLGVALSWAKAMPVTLENSTMLEHLDAGKHLFVIFSDSKFEEANGAHSKEKDAWEELGKLYKDDPKVLIGHIHCYSSAAEVRLCKQHQIKGYPTLAHYKGDEWKTPGRHQMYGGKRDLESLKAFVEDYVRKPKGEKSEL